MAPSTPRKRQKRLLNALWTLQTEDVPMTVARLLEVKYQLRRSKRSVCVTIETPKAHASELHSIPFTIDQDRIPKFIFCQLKDQKLITSCNHQDTIALPAALSIILENLSTEDSNKKHACAAQFRWHCPRTHRTHILFAWLDISMQSRAYTVEELLNLRDAATSNILVDTVAGRDNELVDMLHNKSRVSSASYNTNTVKRGYKKKVEDSSATSDEVIFKGVGTMGRRSFRPEPFQHYQGTGNAHSSQTVQPLTSAHAAPAVMSNTKASGTMTSESDQPTEWKYRGRNGSDTTINEPISAPTGLKAQQNEGFQRFYKAVVSPTHVRVTAGGRIVPNNRNNPVSPTAKRMKDGDTAANGIQPETSTAAPPKPPMAPMMGMPHPMQFFYPGFPGMPPVHPMAGMPMPMMPPGFPFPMPVPNAAMPSVSQEDSHKENLTKKVDDTNDKATSDPEPTKTSIKLSPPEQFDHSKPFMFNGQPWMFPMFPTPYPGFMGMPPPGFPAGPMSGSSMMMPPHMAMPGMMGGPMGPMGPPMGLVGPMGAPPQQVPAPAVSVPASSRQTTPQPPSKPPISSIRPSQITRKQIDGLRASLRYHEDQLQYNKHQIDEKDMGNRIQKLLDDIERFERVFVAQAEYEDKNYPKVDKVKEESSMSGARSSNPSTKTSQSQSEESKESKESSATTATTGSQAKLLRKKDRSYESIGGSSNKSGNASYTYHEAPHMGMSQGRKSTLPSDAARAPIFQPRSVSAFTMPITKGTETMAPEQVDAAEQRLVASGSQGWNTSVTKSNASSQNSLGVPYLVGTLPRGLNAYSNMRIEYEYDRKLTDEELQARHLYWGKAPRSVSQGLPKYDGKNFYPPSPVKIQGDSSPKIRRSIPTGVPEIGYQFSTSSIDPFRAITPNKSVTKDEETEDLACKTPSAESSHSFQTQVGDHAGELQKMLAETASIDLESEASHPKGTSETKSADYNDTRASGTASKIWQSMLKRGLTNSDVLPSTVSSTTAQGFLPPFGGHAASSLSPSISGAISSPSRGSPAKDHDVNTNGNSTFMAQKPADACPPATGERFSETLLNMVGMKAPAWAS